MLSDGLRAVDADLLTLQETIVDDGYDQTADMLDSRYEIIHQRDRESDGQGISTASRWPVGEIIELDINVTIRTGDFACASLITEILAPPPLAATSSSRETSTPTPPPPASGSGPDGSH